MTAFAPRPRPGIHRVVSKLISFLCKPDASQVSDFMQDFREIGLFGDMWNGQDPQSEVRSNRIGSNEPMSGVRAFKMTGRYSDLAEDDGNAEPYARFSCELTSTNARIDKLQERVSMIAELLSKATGTLLTMKAEDECHEEGEKEIAKGSLSDPIKMAKKTSEVGIALEMLDVLGVMAALEGRSRGLNQRPYFARFMDDRTLNDITTAAHFNPDLNSEDCIGVNLIVNRMRAGLPWMTCTRGVTKHAVRFVQDYTRFDLLPSALALGSGRCH